MGLPVLYSFRRCPYAMRARLAIKSAQVRVELREIELRNKPEHMLSISPKATVPVLQLDSGTVIDESMDIMRWALAQNDPQNLKGYGDPDLSQELIAKNDGTFKALLDRYKYPTRYTDEIDATSLSFRDTAVAIHIAPLNELLSNTFYLLGNQPALADLALMPFVRQFAMVDLKWFNEAKFLGLQRWLNNWLNEPIFISVMQKFPMWRENGDPVLF